MNGILKTVCCLTVVLAGGCARTQSIRFVTSEPAQIYARGATLVCSNTPCVYTYERQGCGFPRLMATNSIWFEARTPDGRSAVVGAPDYCDVEDDWVIVLPSASALPGGGVLR